MPELPEVRTMVAFLKTLNNQKIHKIDTFLETMFPTTLKESLENKVIKDVKSKGKYIIFHLSGVDLISHLRMEGTYYFLDHYRKTKHDHVIFTLDKGYLYYNDTRKFGTFDLVEKDTYTNPPLSNIGKEPFEITLEELYQKLHKSNRAIKTLLLDQKIMSGIGNIYADEILFSSKINPHRLGSSLKKRDVKSVIESSIHILNEAIALGGTTIDTFKSNEQSGWFQQKLQVHLRANNPCYRCHHTIKKEKINGRMTYYCTHCQH